MKYFEKMEGDVVIGKDLCLGGVGVFEFHFERRPCRSESNNLCLSAQLVGQRNLLVSFCPVYYTILPYVSALDVDFS